jgi:hypothetical protein
VVQARGSIASERTARAQRGPVGGLMPHPRRDQRLRTFVLCSGDLPGNVIIRKAQRRIQEDERRPGRRSSSWVPPLAPTMQPQSVQDTCTPSRQGLKDQWFSVASPRPAGNVDFLKKNMLQFLNRAAHNRSVKHRAAGGRARRAGCRGPSRVALRRTTLGRRRGACSRSRRRSGLLQRAATGSTWAPRT